MIMSNRNNKYQTGQQFFIRVRDGDLPFQVRIKGYSEETQTYCVQRIGHNNQIWMAETDLEEYIKMADIPAI
jgi:CRISPR/Cas system CMR-associated protein Cmr1 (group 7 of RAMP superfamily)